MTAICPNCNNAFKYRSNLLRHMKYNCGSTKSNQFTCAICQRSFTQKDSLKRHTANTHGCTKKVIDTLQIQMAGIHVLLVGAPTNRKVTYHDIGNTSVEWTLNSVAAYVRRSSDIRAPSKVTTHSVTPEN
nr:unnamed protein product [Callosobruchus chinensis]